MDDGEAQDGNSSANSTAFGAMTGPKILVLVAAVAFLVGAVGYVVGDRQGSADPLNSVDVGFMRDMSFHHEQAVEMSVYLSGKEDVSATLQSYAQEILIEQRYELGFFNAVMDRYGHSLDPTPEDDPQAMGWMGPAMPLESMDGLATEQQIEELRAATGEDAEALFIALMTEHHLGGMHMADYAARHGQDKTTVNLARAMVKTQRGEVIDMDRYRKQNNIAIPPGFSDPLKDQRLQPLTIVDPEN